MRLRVKAILLCAVTAAITASTVGIWAQVAPASAQSPATVAAPASLTVAAKTGYPGQAVLRWTKNTGVTTQNGFQYRYNEGNAAPAQPSGWDISWTDVPGSDGNTLTYTVTGLKAGTQYYFQVRSKNTGNLGESAPVSRAGTTTAAPTLATPTTSSVATTSLTLAWTAPSAINAAFTAYQWQYRYKKTASGSDFTTATGGADWTDVPDSSRDSDSDAHNETQVSLTGLTSATEYEFQVRIDFSGTVGESAAATLTTTTHLPGITPTVAATTSTEGSLTASWTLPPGLTLDGIEYAVLRGTHTTLPADIEWTEVTDTDNPADGSADETSQVIGSLNTGNNYTVWLRGVKAGFTASAPTAVTAATSGLWTPTGLRFVARTNRLGSRWDADAVRRPRSALADVNSIEAKCEPANAPNSVNFVRRAATTSGLNVSGLTPNTEYICSVRSGSAALLNDQGQRPPGERYSSVATIRATTLPAVNAPTSLTFAARTGYPGQATLTWVKNTDSTTQSGTTQTGYQYRYAEGAADPGYGNWDQDWTAVPGSTGSTLSYALSGLKAGTEYYFEVRSTNSGRNGASAAASQTGTIGGGTIAAPSTSSVTTTSLTLSWTRPATFNAAFTAYEWQYRYKKTASGSDFTTATGGAPWTSVPDSNRDGDSDAYNETQISITGLTAATQYEFQVRINYSGDVGESAPSSTTVGTPIPSITPSATSPGEGQLVVTWSLPVGVTVDSLEYAYRIGTHTTLPADITWRAVSDSDTPPDGNADETRQVIAGLNTGNVYSVWVRGVKAGATSETPTAIRATTNGLPTPTGVVVNALTTAVSFTFDSIPSGSGATFIQYQCVVSGRPASLTWNERTARTRYASIQGLTSNTTYDCRLRVRNGITRAIEYDVSSTIFVTTKTLGYVAPTLSAARGTALGSIDLSWTMPSNHQPSPLTFSYRYEKGTSAPTGDTWDSGSGWQSIAGSNYVASTRAGTLTLTGLEGAETYLIQLRVQYSGSNPQQSSATANARGADGPTSLTVAARAGYPGQADLTWVKNTARTTHTGFQYRYDEGSSAPDDHIWDQAWTDVPSSDANTTTYAVPGLKANTQYYFQVRAKHSGNVGNSEPVSQAGTTTDIPTVAAPTTSNVAGVSLTLNWTSPAALNAMFTAYEWQYRYRVKPADPATAWTATWTAVPDSADDVDTSAHNESSVAVTGLTGLTEYEFQVRINFTGDVGETAASAAATATTLIPSITPSVAATPSNDNSLSVSWSLPSGVTLDGFEYAYRLGTHMSLPSDITWQDVPDSASDGRADETAQAITGLDSGTTYTVWIRGEKAGATSADPMPVTASTSGPWRPTGLAATPGGRTIDLDWDDRPSAGAAAHFEYKCEPTASPTSTGWTAIAASTSEATVSNLAANTAHTCSLRSRTGASAPYAYSSAVVTVTATTLAYLTPTLTTASGTDLKTIALSWTIPAGFHASLSGFQYRYEQGAADPGAGNWDQDWTDVPDNTEAGDPDTDRHDERAYTITGLTGNTGYYIQLRAQYGTETSDTSSDTADAKAVAAPTSFTIAARTGYPGQLAVSWQDATNTDRNGYEYRYDAGAAAPGDNVWDQGWTAVPSSTGATRSFNLTGLQAGTQYYVELRATHGNDFGNSVAATGTGTATASPTVAAPSTSSVAATSLTLSWTSPAALNSAFTAYQWQYRFRTTPANPADAWTASWNTVADTGSDGAHNESSVSVTSLSGTTEYEFQVRIDYNGSVGESAASSAASVKTTIPSVTPNVAATAGSDTSLSVTWTALAGGTPDGYEYAYRQGTHTSLPGDITWNDVPDSGSDGRSNETSQTIASLHSGTTYTVWVRGEKTGFTSAAPTATTATTSGPWRPTGFTVTPSARSLTLGWDAKPASASVDNFQYKCATSNLASASWSTTADSTATSVVVSSLTVGTSYMCVIRSRTGATSPYAYSSPDISAMTASTLAFLPPQAPNATTGSAKGEVDLAWTVPAGVSSQLSAFEYRYKKTSDAAYPTTGAGSWANAGSKTATSLTITGIDGNTAYDFQLRSVFGTAGYSDATATLSATSGAVPAPTSLTVAARAGYPGQAVLTWVKNTAVTTQNGYQYRYEEGSSAPSQPSGWDTNWTDVPSSTGATTTYTVTGLKAGTTYYFQVRSTNPGTDGASAPASQSGTTTAAPNVSAPSTGSVTATSLTLSWTSPAALNSAFTAYQWQYRYKTTASGADFTVATGGAPWTAVSDSGGDVDTDAHNETQVVVTGLAGATEYQFQVRIDFTGAVGESAASASTTVKTLIPSITPSVMATSGSNNGLTVNWTSPAGGTLDSLQYATSTGTHSSLPAGVTWIAVTDTDVPTDGNIDETSQAITNLNSGTAYTVWVRGVKAGFTTAAPTAQSASTTGPWRPTGLRATPSGTTVALDWDDRPSASVATDFEYKCQPTSNVVTGGWATAISAATSNATVTSLSVSTPYTCSVRSRTGTVGSYVYSTPLTTVTTTTLSHTVPALTATAGSAVGSIALSWTMAVGYESTLSGFQYRWEPGAAAPSDGVWNSGAGWQAIPLSNFDSTTRNGSLTISTGLVGNTGYYIQLRAVYGTEYSEESSDTATSGAVSAPTSFTIAARTGYPGQLALSWQNVANTDRDGYEIRYDEGSAAPADNMWDQDWTAISGSTGTTTSSNLTGLKAGTQYYVELRATHGNNKGNSTVASATGTTTATPTVAAPSTSSVAATSLTLSWTTPAALNASFTAYQWQYRFRTKPSNPADAWTATWNTVADTGSDGAHNESSVAVTGLSGTTEYEFQVRIDFTGSVGESAASSAASVKTLIPSITPTANATSGSDTSLSVTWSALAGGTPDGYEYAYQQGTHTSLPAIISWNDVPDSGSDGRSNETSETILSLNSGTTYTVWVRGEKTGFTTATPAAVTQTTSGPWRPTGFTATPGGTDIALDWTNRPSAGVATHFEYKCEPTASPTSSGWETAIDGGTSNATVTGLTVNTAYTCTVRSRIGSVGSYEYSSPATTATATTLAHVPPTLTAASGTDLRTIALSWTLPMGFHADLSGFQYRYEQGASDPGAGNWDVDWTDVPDNTDAGDPDTDRNDERAFTITGLVGNTGYYIQLRAQYGTEVSTASSGTATAKAVAAPTINPPSFDLNPDPDVHPGAIELSWYDTNVVIRQIVVPGLQGNNLVDIYGPPTYRTGYEYRYEKGSVAPTDGMWDQDWTNVDDMDDPADGRGDENEITLTGLEFGTAYYIQLRSQNSGNYGDSEITSRSRTSGASPSTIPTPTAPARTSATVTLQWADLGGVVREFTEYNWQYRYRIKPTSGTPAWTATWNDVADGTDTGDSAHDENRVTVSGLTAATEYEFQIRIKSGEGASSASSSVFAKTEIPSITPTVGDGADDNSLAVNWTIPGSLSVDGFEYSYRQGTHSGSPGSLATWHDVADSGSDGRSNETAVTISGLDSGTTYTVWLRGEKAGFATPSSVAATRTTTGPWRPTGFAVTRGSTTLTLSWDAKPAGASVDHFQYKCAASNLASASWSTTADGTATSVTVSGLTVSTSYMCTIRARTGATTPTFAYSSPDISPKTATTLAFVPPEAPTAATGSANGQVNLTWQVPAAASGQLSGFEYRYKKSSDATYATSGPGSWTNAGTKTATSVTVTGLDGNRQYDFQLRSVFGTAGYSTPTTKVSATSGAVAAPASLNVSTRTGYPGQATLTWTKNTGVSTQSGFQFRYEEGLSAPSNNVWDQDWTDVPGSNGNTLTHHVTGLRAGRFYYFQVRSKNSGNNGVSKPASRSGNTTPIPTVAAPTTSSVTTTSLTLAWTRPAALNAAFTAYQWQYRYKKTASGGAFTSATGGAPWTSVPDSASDAGSHVYDETQIGITGLTATTEYEFQVRINYTGAVGESAASSSATVKTQIPSITPTVTAPSGNNNSLTVSWSAPSGGTPDGFEYASQRGSHTSLPAVIMWHDVIDSGSDGRSNETSQAIPNLHSGTTYTVWIRGEKTGFTSAAPAAVTQTTSGPWRPTGLMATATGTTIALDWDDRPSATVAAHFEYKCEPTSSPTSGGWQTAIVATTSQATVTGLNVDTAYTCTVRSRTGASAPYEYSSPTLTIARMTQAHFAPTLSATAGTAVGSIDLSWTMMAGYESTLSGFQYRYEKGAAAPGDSVWDSGAGDGWQTIALSTFTAGTRLGAHTVTGLSGNAGYYIQLRAHYGTETSASDDATATSKAVAAPAVNAPPQDPSGQVHPGAITITWSHASVGSATRTGYEYRYDKGTVAPTGAWDQDWTDVPDMDNPPDGRADETSITLTGLEFNTGYFVEVRSEHSGVTGYSEAQSATRTSDAEPSTLPTLSTSMAATTSMRLNWTALTGVVAEFNEYSWQYRYRVKPSTGNPAWTATWNTVADSSDAGTSQHDETGVTVTGLTATTEYEFQIRIKSGDGTSGVSNTAAAKTLIPSITPSVMATAANDRGLTITWTIPSGGTLDGFEYAHRPGAITSLPSDLSWNDVIDTGGDGRSNETTESIDGLHSGTTYTVWVRGEKTGFTTATPMHATTNTSGPWYPTGFTASPSGTSIALDWEDRPLAAGPVTHFEYKCEPTASLGTGTWSAQAASMSTDATVSSLTVNTGYTCSLRSRTGSVGSYKYSSPVETKAAMTAAHLPPTLTASAGTAVGSIDLSWSLPSGYDATSLSSFQYRYEQGSAAPANGNWDSGAGWQTIPLSAFTSGTRMGAYTLSTLIGNTGYYIELRAVYGTEQSSSDNDTATSRAVAAPTTFAVAARSAFPGQLAVSWQDATNTDRTGYQYRYDEGSTSPADSVWDQDWIAVPSSGNTTRAFNISGLKANTGYYVEVRATHSNNKGNSEIATGTGTATAVPTLAAPTTSAVTTTTATLLWTRPSTSALDSSVTTYNWQYRYKKTASGGAFTTATGGVAWTDVPDSARDGDSDAHNETQISLTNLTAATEYQFQVRIDFDDGDLGETAAVSVTTKMLIPTPSITVSAATDPGSVTIDIAAYAAGVTVDKFQVRRVNSADACATTTASGWTGWSDIAGTGSSAITHTISSLTPNTRWKFEVRPQKTGFTSAGTACESLMLAMVPAPTGFTVANVANTPGSIKLDWTGPTSSTIANFAYRYKVTSGGSYNTATGGVAWTDVPDGSDAGTLARDERTITLTGLQAGTGYTVQLRVEYSSALGDSGPVSATVTTVAVNPPTSVSATSTANSVTVSWTASTSVGVTRVDSRHRKTGGSWSNWTTNGPAVGTTSLAISSLDGASEYQVEVRAHVSNAVGNSAAASVTQKTLIPAITNLAEDSATQDPGTTTLKWDALGDNGRVDKFQYRYERGTAVPSDGNWDQSWTDVSANGSSAVTHAVSGLVVTTDYYFQVQAVKTGYTSVSANLTVTTGSHITLSGVSASAGTAPGSVDLSWTKPSHSNIQEYRFRFKKASDAAYPTSGTGSWTTVSGGATPSSITVTNLANNVSHNFEVLAYYGSVTDSSTAGSATSTSSTLPAPTGFDAEQGTLPGSIALTWNSMASTSEVDKFQYRFEEGSTAPADNIWDQDWTDVPSSTRSTTSFQITGRTAGTTFLIQLRAVGTGIIGVSGTVQDTSAATTAPAPTGFSASTGSDVGEVDLSWNAGAGISLYQYRYKQTTAGQYPSTGAGSWTPVPDQDTPPDGQGDETSYTVTGLVPGVEYHIQIRAQVTNVGSSAATTAQAVTVKSVAAPRNFSAGAGTNPGTIALRWLPVQTSALRTGDSVIQYEYRYKLQTESQYVGWTAVPDGSDANNLASDETSAVISNLSNGKQYDIQLRAAIDDNDADSTVDYYTDTASRTGITARAVPVPSNFRAATSSTAAGAIDLTWTAQTAVTTSSAQYEYRYKLQTASSYGNWTAVPDGEDTGSNAWDETSATISSLTAETNYDIQLRFYVSSDVGASTEASSTAAASRVPSAMNFSVNPGGAPGSISLSWEAVDGATKYEYRCNPAGTGCTTTWQEVPDGSDADSSQANETSYTVTGLTPGVRYTLELRAFVDGVGYGAVARSSSLAQTQPGPDTISFTQGDNPGEITITWTAPTQGAVDRYEFQYRISGTQYNAWADAGTSPYTITGLHAGSRYDVRFRVVTPSGGYSLPNVGTLNTKTVPPPTSFAAAMGTNPGEIDLSWTPPTGVTILRFEYRHRTGTGEWSSWSAVPDQDDPPDNDAGDETAYALTGLLGGASYTFELRAVMQTVGHSASVSATVSATPIPPPTEPMAEAGEFPGDITISWTAAEGATSYQYRAKPQGEAWSAEHTWASVAAPATSATISGLAQGQVHDVEVRAVVANVGYSPVATTTATSQEMIEGTAEVPAGSAVSAARVPGKIVITLPSDTEAVVYRTQPTNPGAWSPYITYRPTASERQFEIPNLKPGTEYNVEAHFYLEQQQVFTQALRATVRTAPLAAPANFRVESTNGVMLMSWDGPGDLVEIQGYEYRTRQSGSATWSDWVAIGGAGSGTARRQHHVAGLLAGTSHDFELRLITAAGPGPVSSATASAMVRLPSVTRIEPNISSLTVRTDSTIILEVIVYDSQNGISDDVADGLVISWYATGDADVQEMTDSPRAVYRAPSQPGRYTVTATAGPAGICRSHHITVTGPDPCEVEFTILVIAPPQVPGFSAIPQNPTGVIPETILGEDTQSYTVITPERGGMVSDAGATVRVEPAAVLSGEYIGVRLTEGEPVGSIGQESASASTPAHDAYIGFRTHTLAGNLYRVAVVDMDGVTSDDYEFVLPAVVCVPLPSNLQDYTGRIVLVGVPDDPTGGLTVLGSRTYSSGEYGIQVCASVRELPVTVAAAKRGIDESLLPLDPTGAVLPDAGGVAPSVWLLAALFLAGLATLGAGRFLASRQRGNAPANGQPGLRGLAPAAGSAA